MNRVPPIQVELSYQATPDGTERLQRVYDHLIEIALHNLERRESNPLKLVDNHQKQESNDPVHYVFDERNPS